MNIVPKLYLSLAIVFSMPCITYTHDEHASGIATVQSTQKESIDVLETIDNELLAVLNTFFDKNDTTNFTTIINKIIEILKLKQEVVEGVQKNKCAEIIKKLEENKHNYHSPLWIHIILDINYDLQALMSEKTRTYINNIKGQDKIQALIARLQRK